MWDKRVRRRHKLRYGVPLLNKGTADWSLVLSSHDRNGRSYKGMKGAGKKISCMGEGGLLLLLLLAEKSQ